MVFQLKWFLFFQGAAFTPFVRLLPPAYDDGNNAVAGEFLSIFYHFII